MKKLIKSLLPGGDKRRARGANSQFYTTKSGRQIKLNRSLYGRLKAKREARSRARAAYKASLPRNRFKRLMYQMHPKRMAQYWSSPEGRIMGLKVVGIGILVCFLVLVGVFAYFRKDLPNLRDVSGNNIGGSVQYYDRTGEILLWEDFDAVRRTPVEENQIAQVMKDATIATEDKDFYDHGGFDIRAISRAGINNLLNRDGGLQGGSTITQQLVKLTQDWTQDRTITRKIKELILSVELERTFTKDEILTGYLNTAPYGDITFGVEAAMQDYFNKSAKKITLDEAAFLAAMPQSPTFYSPHGAAYSREALLARQDFIVDQMVQQGMITKKKGQKAKKVDTLSKLKPRKAKYANIKAPWFVLTAKEQLMAERGAETVQIGGLKVTTTLDMDLQKLAEKQIADNMWRVQAQGGDTAAFVAEDVKTGQVVALVGGSDFRNKTFGQNNYARAKLPPGSSFKPYDYTALINSTNNFGAGTVLYDSQGPLDGYPCTTGPRRDGNCAVDYDFRFPGPMTLRYALGASRNIPAMKAMLIAGVEETQKVAKNLMKSPGTPAGEARGNYECYSDENLTKEAPCYTSSAIGDGAYLKLDEHVHGFATISRNGRNLPQSYMLKVEDAAGETIIEWEKTKGEQAVKPDSAYIVSDIISDPSASYLSSKPHDFNGWKFGFKTGTTNDSKDGWMMSMSTRYAAGTWVGYHNRERELSGFMETMTQPIVQGWMYAAHEGLEPEERPKPKGIKELPAYVVRSHVGGATIEPSPSTDLFPSWYNKNPKRRSQTIDRVSNKLATNCTPSRAKQVVGGVSADLMSADPWHGPGATRGTSGRQANFQDKDDVHRCSDAKPRVTLSAPAQCQNSCTITATVSQGTHPISSSRFPGTVNLLVGGNRVGSRNIGGPGTVSFHYNVAVNGNHTVTAEVIDSVLYDSRDSRPVTFSKQQQSINLNVNDLGGNSYRFVWNHVPGRAPYELCIAYPAASSFSCSGASSGATYSKPLPANESGKAYVKPKSGPSSNTVTF